MEYFSELDPILRTFWFIALPASLIFVIQSVMTFMGTDSHDGLNADFDSNFEGVDAPFQLFSFRNLINFMLGFSWTGISLFYRIDSIIWLLILCFVVGLAFVLLFFILIQQIQRLAEDNSFKITDCIGKTGDVYIPIPEKKAGKGKIQISVNGAFHELDAVTEGEKIESGQVVIVKEIVSSNILIVEKI
jgi:hypothetical protein